VRKLDDRCVVMDPADELRDSAEVSMGVVRLEEGRALSDDELDVIAKHAAEMKVELSTDELRKAQARSACNPSEDAGSESEAMPGSSKSNRIETKRELYLLGGGKLEVKNIVPRDPMQVLDSWGCWPQRFRVTAADTSPPSRRRPFPWSANVAHSPFLPRLLDPSFPLPLLSPLPACWLSWRR